ncbi:MAG: hypothetical protein ACREQZ_10690 [Woeseiaceae bacterium]
MTSASSMSTMMRMRVESDEITKCLHVQHKGRPAARFQRRVRARSSTSACLSSSRRAGSRARKTADGCPVAVRLVAIPGLPMALLDRPEDRDTPFGGGHFARYRSRISMIATLGRRILPEAFVSQYFGAREVVNRLKAEFGKDLTVDLLLKNRDNSPKVYKANIARIDDHVPERYAEAEVLKIIENHERN